VTLGSIIRTPEYGLSQSGQAEGSTGFLNVQHIRTNGRISFDPPVFLRDDPGRRELRTGDILIARTGHTLGKAALIPDEFAGYSWGSFCIRLSLLCDAPFRGGFVARFLNSRLGQLQILMLKTGAGKFNINSEQIMDIRLPELTLGRQDEVLRSVRPLEAQAAELQEESKLARRGLEAMVPEELAVDAVSATKRDYFFRTGKEGRSLWFHKRASELTGRLHYLFHHPGLAILDSFFDRYETVALSDICREPISRGVQPEYEEGGEVTVLKTVDLQDGYIDFENALKVSEDFFLSSTEAHVRRGDILVASTGYVSMGKVDVYDSDEAAMISGELLGLRVRDEYDPSFVACFLRSHLGKVQFDKWFSGSSGQIHLYDSDLSQFLVPASTAAGVPVGEQIRIASIVTDRMSRARDLERQAEDKWREAQLKFEGMVA